MKLQYTVDAQGVHIQGVDKTNPVIYDNDMIKDTPEMFYLWLKANRKECNLVGNISSHNSYPGITKPSETQPVLLQEFNRAYSAFTSMGGKNVPAPILGSSKNMTAGQTTWENSPGSDLIIAEAKKASASKPLVIFVGGSLTTVANAYLKDKSIKDNIIVFQTDGWGQSNYNCYGDSWAPQVLIDNGVKYINWDGDLNSWYYLAGSPNYRGEANDGPGNPIKRMPGITFANINNAFHNIYKSNFEYMYRMVGQIADAPPVFWFFNNAVWKNVVKRNKSNQTVTTEDFAFLLISQNEWNAYGPQLSSYMNNPVNYVPVTTPLPNQPPSVAIISGNSAAPGSVTLTAIASDDQQVTKVEFFVDGVKIGEDTDSPYNATWQATIGTYEITAKATDNQGAATTSAPVSVVVADVVEPLPGDCECDVQAGVTETLSAGLPATVTSRKEGKTHVFDFGIPQGPPGSSTGGGTITLGKGQVDVRNHGAKGDGSNDDAIAFTKAWDSVRGTGGDVIVPYPDNFYNFKTTFNAFPDGSNQAYVNIIAGGMQPAKIRYTGASNQPAIKIIGLKCSMWRGLKIAITDGRDGCQIIDIITPDAARGSSSVVTFSDFRLHLGKGQDNIGIRTGFGPHDGDISNYEFMNIGVYGGGGLKGAAIPGQYAFQNLGANTLSQTWKGGFVANCDRVYSNISRNGLDRGNGSVMCYGLGGAHNNTDFVFGYEQNYLISGGRWENGNSFLKVADGGFSSTTVSDLSIKGYNGVDGTLLEMARAGSLIMSNVQIAHNDNRKFANPVRLSANGRAGSLVIMGGGIISDAAKPYVITGNTKWDVTVLGVARIEDKVWSEGHFPNEIGTRP